jgi:tRNA G37 N-methylase Trm5
MRSDAMMKICLRLENEGVRLENLYALDFFAREGDWQTIDYSSKVKNLEAWEINPDFFSGLKRNLPKATIRIVDSYVYGMQTNDRFDFIVLDNPQATFGPEGMYCEHFEALPIALRLLKPEGFIVFNLNWAPFNFDNHPEWQRRRAEFYNIKDTTHLSLEKFLIPFYQRYFEFYGFNVIQRFSQSRNDDYLAYAVYRLTSK